MTSEATKRLIQRVVNVFEHGTPDGRYDSLVISARREDGRRCITFGRAMIREDVNLKKLVLAYIRNGGVFREKLFPYLDRIGREPLADNTRFRIILAKAAREDPVMRDAQDHFFDTAFYNPALRFFERNQFALPLSLLVIFDSYIHSGGVQARLRNRLPEPVPLHGGEERRWIASYVEARHQWLKTHSDPRLRKAACRTQCFRDQIATSNWKLAKLPIIANGVKVI